MGQTPPGAWDTWPDEELVGLAQVRLAGRKSAAWRAFEILYRRHIDEVLNTVYLFLIRQYILADHDLAGQLAQQAFLKAWEGLPEKKPQPPFLLWIKRIGINEARQYMRHHRPEIALKEEAQRPTNDPLEPSPEEQVEQLLSTEELREKIERIKLRLPDRQRTVFTMHHEQGYRPQEIALALGLKPANVWQTLWRANKRFRKEWLKEGDNGGLPSLLLKPRRGGAPGTSSQP